jgi:hypothetical protein
VNELLDTFTATSLPLDVKARSAAHPAGDWRHRVHAGAEAPSNVHPPSLTVGGWTFASTPWLLRKPLA